MVYRPVVSWDPGSQKDTPIRTVQACVDFKITYDVVQRMFFSLFALPFNSVKPTGPFLSLSALP